MLHVDSSNSSSVVNDSAPENSDPIMVGKLVALTQTCAYVYIWHVYQCIYFVA